MNELSRFLLLGFCILFLLLSGCETQPAPAEIVDVPTAVPAAATNTPTIVPPTATAVPTLTSMPAPTVLPPVVPLHFDHLQDVLPEDEIEARLAPWLFEPDVANALSLDELADVSVEGEMTLTSEQAKEDVAYLFALLKNGYAGYGYFNENGRFDRVQAQLKAAIDDQPRVSREWLLQQMLSRLDFVQDCHFSIAGSTLCQQQYFWYVADWYFYEGNGRYFTEQEGEQWWLTAVAGESPENVLKLTFDEQGTPAYLLGQLANSQPEDSLLTFELPDGDDLEEMVEWETAVFEPPITAYEYYRTESGIPVVVSRSFSIEDEKLPNFVADAASLADEPILIVDIRGNSGGRSHWALHWMQNLTDLTPTTPHIAAALWTTTAVQGKINGNFGYEGPIMDGLLAELVRLKDEEGGWTDLFIPTFTPLPNDNQLVIVLFDKRVASAGEEFIGYLRQLENVLFIGENSTGATQFGELVYFVLPYTGWTVQFGSILLFPPDLAFIEGIGYLPDIWVPADQALDKTLAAIEAGWLQPKP